MLDYAFDLSFTSAFIVIELKSLGKAFKIGRQIISAEGRKSSCHGAECNIRCTQYLSEALKLSELNGCKSYSDVKKDVN